MPDMDQIFAWLGMASAAVTFADMVVSAFAAFAQATPTKVDDELAVKAAGAMSVVKSVFRRLSLLNDKR